jgi:IS30 family transposase
MKHLTLEQRYTISVMKKQNYSQKKIALTIEKDKSVVSRELKRNCDKRNGGYNSDLAQRKYNQRQKDKPKHIKFTKKVESFAEKLLCKDYSPEQIVGRAKLYKLNCVSHERLYQHIWKDKKQGGELHLHLRRRGRKYRKRGAAKDTRGIIIDRIGISQRPAIVEQKERLGDLEIDTIIGQNHKGALLTINDRVSSMVWIAKLNGKNAEDLAQKAIEVLSPYKEFMHTITGDNGKEFAEHKTISQSLNIDFYFARPYHSWERGANENTNGLIRQYFAKGSSFENITDKDVAEVQEILNNRPRKKLEFLTPTEYFFISLLNQKVAFVT